jgi:CheY-like chemotaxis protein
MTQPLALVLYERLLPGTQLVNRLQDLKYRVQTLAEPGRLVQVAQETKPMLVFADLQPAGDNVCAAIERLKKSPDTSHLPIVAFGAEEGSDLHQKAQGAGVTLLVGETALLNHLPQLMEQALQVE